MKKLRSVLSIAIVCALCFALLAACGSGGTPAPSGSGSTAAPSGDSSDNTKVYTLKFGSVVNNAHMAYGCMENFEKRLEEASNGRIDVQLYGSSQLGGEREMIEGMSMGTIEMFYGGSMTLGSFTNAAKFQSLPFMFTGGFDAAHEFFDLYGADISQQIEDETGVKVIWTENGTFDPLTNKVISTPADFKGLKMRCHEVDVMLKAYDALGAQPTAMAFAEIYTGLQQGTIDGCNTTSLLIDSSKFYEQCKVFNNMNLFYDMGVTGISSSWLEGLPQDLQELVIKEAKAFSAEYNSNYAQGVAAAEDRMVNQHGLTVKTYTQEELEPFIQAVQPAYDWFRKNVNEPNLDKYLDALKEINSKHLAS